MKGVYIFLANGFEEMEALAPLDILRRGGVDVKTVSIHRDKYVTGSHRATVVADMTYDEFKAEVQLDGTEENDVMIFPGGMPGTRRIAENAEIINFMRLHYAEGGALAAICRKTLHMLRRLRRRTCCTRRNIRTETGCHRRKPHHRPWSGMCRRLRSGNSGTP